MTYYAPSSFIAQQQTQQQTQQHRPMAAHLQQPQQLLTPTTPALAQQAKQQLEGQHDRKQTDRQACM
jgi:hypothetical protein